MCHVYDDNFNDSYDDKFDAIGQIIRVEWVLELPEGRSAPGGVIREGSFLSRACNWAVNLPLPAMY